ncbi:Erv1 / Alr family protein [Besnoitia besnoiti]|uniref:Sulfhydryl oxidase n=1 Tax=Besnoitia besnoiti TaxID=94643 RepID=A0A2A9M2Y2_BESBE|nr:Erv1 / Alr family protein [Besnoitia besnoiti]PFH32299.1 Erv1 / Alr family protein [Besnoitia besnoiti]
MQGAPASAEETPAPASTASACPCGTAQSAGTKKPAAPLSPPNREQIGRASWRVLHSMAARYPEVPNSRQVLEAAAWIFAFSALYPCQICRLEFFPILRQLPPRLDSRNAFVLWACAAHNRVNEDISAPRFACSLDVLRAMGK